METIAHDIARLYERDIVDAGKQPQLVILAAFLVTFLTVRLVTHAIRSGRARLLRNFTPRGTHVHHLVWGILLLLTTGYFAIAFAPEGYREVLALSFGVGAALTLDEFALWLRLKDVYWAKEGRASIDAVIVASAIFALFVVGQRFWFNAARLLADAVDLL